jgi:hypothetical protein
MKLLSFINLDEILFYLGCTFWSIFSDLLKFDNILIIIASLKVDKNSVPTFLQWSL